MHTTSEAGEAKVPTNVSRRDQMFIVQIREGGKWEEGHLVKWQED